MIGDEITYQGRPWKATKLLGRGKSAYSWLVESRGERLVYKKMHQEKVDYYEFGDKLKAELEAYAKLKASGIALPALRFWSEEGRYLIKDFITGPTAAELAASGQLTEKHFSLAWSMHLRLKEAGLHVDWFPTNFIFADGQIYLIDFECHPYNAEWDLPSWGIYYWLNARGMKEHLELGRSEGLNHPGSPKPITEPFEGRKEEILLAIGAA